tara:strand:- start:290 stop:493 length:204 start_codon:yes stop_codon:yes gene_type:complete
LRSGVLVDLDLEHVLLADAITTLVVEVEDITPRWSAPLLEHSTLFVLLVMVTAVEENAQDVKVVHLM